MSSLPRWMYPAFGLMVACWTGGCAGGLGTRTPTGVIFVSNGAVAPMTRAEYTAIKGQLKTMLAERGLALSEDLFQAKLLATVEIQPMPGESVAVVAVRGTRENPMYRPVVVRNNSDPADRPFDLLKSPAFDLARTLDKVN